MTGGKTVNQDYTSKSEFDGESFPGLLILLILLVLLIFGSIDIRDLTDAP